MSYKIKQAFTLTEVLVVVAIIGIIAAITLPALINDIQKQIYVTGLKKFYEQTNQILANVAIQNCSPGTIDCFSSVGSMTNAIVSQFKKVKDCGISNKGCWAVSKLRYDGSSSDSYDLNTWSWANFITPEGMSVAIGVLGYCEDRSGGDINSPLYKHCGDITVDLNGPKPPNLFGRDVFSFAITSNKVPLLYPLGGKGYNYYGTYGHCSPTNTWGDRCAGRIMEESWQMNY